ncbi:16S rRNA (uracil(1498)-N(3))-methyltransferase [Candidatus Liberibacter sp.]|uniref:16S rRNA (uracil(1498)-N(3))-methyltransferase n=1 Tax=Candidatus Liberibacter sp. TaxID=34022 RepID=UPI0015F54A98|nr:16S rRNA (uracil(1498)-N(3))-methyltransferase [Candidatus Liberibacter sp.]MBA5723838.1 16S rRNA (uracil(1498)-N(3))-methyltransferase [Candidatus Liberibacter sp.]
MILNSNLKRLFVDFSLLTAKNEKTNESQYHYLAHVLRMKEREKILLFNGRDGEWESEISYQQGKSITFNVMCQKRKQTQPFDLHYLFAPIKTKRLDYMIQKSVEMGVGAIRPVITRYTQGKTCDTDRMRTYAISAAEQCNILSIPSIEKPIMLSDLLKNWTQNRHIIFADETCNQTNPLNILQKIPKKIPLAILVGPEAGFHSEEKENLHALSFVTAISLGPRILRADTAAVAAMALVQSSCGDWEEG